ncbi:regulatory protein GemA [Kaistia dalseonensis]|uniref:Phage gp16-like protein n=1 Tax=Kaistia dalseonensis TaxID=410840 RepID=A0ABU0HC98_9HYPH|nr:regulatory protein GemA [Kaistia dalseonensis]MCX5497303.1 regulatory protein GemA [Kaistia dalseonensis]MDQ0439940.1 phage gp16-like protein [Kaistia dalseonensis]
MNSIAIIHVAKKQLQLEDDDYRALLIRVTGKASSRDMSEAERGLVVEEMRRLGFHLTPPKSREPKVQPAAKGALDLGGPNATKLRALWISGWNLGVVKDRADTALVAFVKKQTGIDHLAWLRDPRDAAKAIEAIKAWLARAAGVKWPGRAPLPSETKRAVASAQLAILGLPADALDRVADLDAYIADLGAQVRKAKKP